MSARQGLRANWAQFSLLVLINGLVGAMIGMERAVLPALAAEGFGMEAQAAILSFIVVFGVSKALTNYLAGRLSDAVGRRPVLIAGWLLAAPTPLLLGWAPSWGWVLAANALLGVSQGLAWSTAVIMKIDLAGARHRGLAMGLNEAAGYLAVAASALASGWLAARYGLQPAPFTLGIAYVALGTALSVGLVRETLPLARLEAPVTVASDSSTPSQRQIFWQTTLLDRDLSTVTQAGFVNNLNDGMAWGLFPAAFAAAGIGLADIGWLAALYPAVWGTAQLGTGALSDRLGRRWLIAGGMLVQAAGIAVVAGGQALPDFAAGQILLGLGTAMVYPTLLAAIGDIAHPAARASTVGVYRLWRDLGYAAGAIIAGLTADALGLTAAISLTAAITLASGLLAAARLRETLAPKFMLS